DLLLFPVDFVSEETADRADLGSDGLVVKCVGVEPRYECGRAQLMARKVNRDAGHARGAAAYCERAGRRADASQCQCEPPAVPQPVHPSLSARVCTGVCLIALCAAVCRRADTTHKDA